MKAKSLFAILVSVTLAVSISTATLINAASKANEYCHQNMLDLSKITNVSIKETGIMVTSNGNEYWIEKY